MELISMTLENYRRFNEKTTINFARGDNNVTVSFVLKMALVKQVF